MNDRKTSPNRQKKEKIIKELTEKATRAKGIIFTSYQGLTHKQLEGLKKAVKAFNADFVATKNTLLLRSLASYKDKLLSPFAGATATLFLYGDPIPPLKEIAKAIKEFNLPKIKFGILDGESLTENQVLKISSLPSREILLTQLVFGLKSPISGLHRSLLWNIQKFVMTLKAVGNLKNQNSNIKSASQI
ncbi:50S ribosomal protein L10 [Candidatus Roizmanbacteria bacterium]|nr:50S ribosomal protein L10 [Candidatus Roizmanbacteria bacterium]